MVTKTIGDVRKLGSNLHASLVTPGSTRREKRNGKVNIDDGVMDAPDTACRCSPMSLHAIAHLRDVEDDEENQEDCAEEVTAKQRRLQMGVSNEWDSESDEESVDDVSVDKEVEYNRESTNSRPTSQFPARQLLICLFQKRN
jgi:hypothetical protein